MKIDVSTLKCCSHIPPKTFFYDGKRMTDSIGFRCAPSQKGIYNAANCKGYFIDTHIMIQEYKETLEKKDDKWVDLAYLIPEYNSRYGHYEFDGENCRSYHMKIALKRKVLKSGKTQYNICLNNNMVQIDPQKLIEAYKKHIANPPKKVGKMNTTDFTKLIGSTTVIAEEYVTF